MNSEINIEKELEQVLNLNSNINISTNTYLSLQDQASNLNANLDIDKSTPHFKEMIIKNNSLEIDGCMYEGGGQILRISISLSILFQKVLKFNNIRGNRSNPGLQNQHLAATSLICAMTGTQLEGAKILSKEVTLTPSHTCTPSLNNSKCDCNGAGSIGLLIQQILPCVIFSKSKFDLVLIGGTLVSNAPPVYYINDILKVLLKDKMGIDFKIEIKKHGLFPIGGGLVSFTINPLLFISPINIISRGGLKKVLFRIASTNNFVNFSTDSIGKEIFKELKKNVNSYMKSSLDGNTNMNMKMNQECDIEDIIKFEKESILLQKTKNTYTFFSQIIFYFENTIISVEELYSEKKEDKLNHKKYISDILNKMENILFLNKVCLDEFTVDDLIIFMALAKGMSRIHIGEISKHTITAIELIKQFIPKIEVKIEKVDTDGSYNVLEINGIGMLNENFIEN